MTRRRWIADSWDESTATLTGDQAAHLARVLRAQPGMEFDLVAGGFVWRAAIRAIEEGSVHFDLLAEVHTDPALPLTLLLSIFKFDRMEWAVEKLTELGVERIVPVIARRSEKHLVQAAAKRVERWRRIVREASQQSRRSDVPEIEDVSSLSDAVAAAPESFRLLLAEQERATSLHSVAQTELQSVQPRPVRLAIGPEGGWAPEEVSLFERQGWKPVSLGPRILRAETAAMAATAVLAALCE